MLLFLSFWKFQFFSWQCVRMVLPPEERERQKVERDTRRGETERGGDKREGGMYSENEGERERE